MEPNRGEVPKASPAPAKSTLTWGLVAQFIAAVLVVAVLVAGPQLWEVGGRLKDYVQGYLSRRSNHAEPIGPLRVSPPVKMPSKPTAAPAVSAPSAPATLAPPAPASTLAVKKVVVPSTEEAPRRSAAPIARTSASAPAARPTPLPSLRNAGVKRAPTPRPTATPATKWQSASEVAAAAAAPRPGMSPQQYFESLMRQGLQLYQSGWYGPAFGRFKQASMVMPASPNPLVWEARAAMHVGRYGEARQALERAIVLAPASPAAREARALLETFK
jgi:hypothetical protein